MKTQDASPFLDAKAMPPEGSVPAKPTGEKQPDPKDAPDYERKRRWIQSWQKRITERKNECESAFHAMAKDAKFARGLQWSVQKTLEYDKYVCNLVLRNLAQGVALLYARNPEVAVSRRDRMDFTLWDGKEESIAAARMAQQQAAMTGSPSNPMADAMTTDYSEGQLWRDMLDRICQTLQITTQYMFDSLKPGFKKQMKQLVRRAKTCGVGYVQINYVDGHEGSLSTSETESTIMERGGKVKHIADGFVKGTYDAESPKVYEAGVTLQSAVMDAVGGSQQNLNQRITFDFLPPASVIVDKRCRSLNGFVGARWLVVEKSTDLDTVNSTFGLNVSASAIKTSESEKTISTLNQPPTDAKGPKRVKLWEVEDLETKTYFTLLEGYDDFIVEPAAPIPDTNAFWSIVALVFNEVEYDPSAEDADPCGVYPPSDVALMRSPQLEWNRTRQALRVHRIANTPKYMTGKGWLTEDDKDAINDSTEDSAVIELQGATSSDDIGKKLAPFKHDPIQPTLYDTQVLTQDIQLAAGTQETTLGNPSPKVTATGATIAEQSKNNVAASNVDDLDDFLSEVAEICGEIILKYFTLETVQRIAGRGAVLPQQNREDYLNQVLVSTKAASSGRPNKAMDIANFERIVPLIIQALTHPGGPLTGLAEEGLRRLDDKLDLSRLMEQGPPPPVPPQQQNNQQNQAPQGGSQQPLQENPSQQSVPLAAA